MNLVIKEMLCKEVIALKLNRPEKCNALNIPLMEELKKAIEHASDDPNVRILFLEGEGPSFCSGLDMCEAGDEECIEYSAKALAYLLSTLYTTSLVTIALVQGYAMGGGAGLMCACDFALGTDDLQIGFPEVRRGLVAAQVMTFLVRSLDRSHISELVLLGENVDAAKAKEMGLLHAVVPKDELRARAEEYTKKILLGAPGAVKETKRFMDALYPSSFSDDLYNALTHHHKVRHSTEAQEGVAAFMEKRKPYWVA